MYLIIGQGAAGSTAARMLRQMDSRTPVMVVTDEKDYFYSRIDLPDIIAGKYESTTAVLQTAEDFARQGISCRMGERVVKIVPAEKIVRLESGEVLPYEKLLLASGSQSVIPSIVGGDVQGLYSLWTLAQAREIANASIAAKRAVVVGAGLIGVKTALALAARGLSVTIVEQMTRIMPRQLDAAAAEILANRIRDKGVDIRVNTSVESIVDYAGVVTGVQLSSGILPAEIVVMSVGVRPNISLTVETDIATGRGILVNEFQQTSVPDIYAAGDVAEAIDHLTGKSTVSAIWPVAVEQGRIAACNMSGCQELYGGSIAMNSVEIAGIPLVSVGDIEGQPGDDILVAHQGNVYRKVIMREQRVRGVLCLGDIRQAGVIGGLILRQVKIDAAEKLMSPVFSYADLITV